jgi:hypothetical protein
MLPEEQTSLEHFAIFKGDDSRAPLAGCPSVVLDGAQA